MEPSRWIVQRSQQEQQALSAHAEALRAALQSAEEQIEVVDMRNAKLERDSRDALSNYNKLTRQFVEAQDAYNKLQKETPAILVHLESKASRVKAELDDLRSKIQLGRQVRAAARGVPVGNDLRDPPKIKLLLKNLGDIHKEIADRKAACEAEFNMPVPTPPDLTAIMSTEALEDQCSELQQTLECCKRMHRLERNRCRYLEYAMSNQVRLCADGREFDAEQEDQFGDDIYEDFLVCLVKRCNEHRQNVLLSINNPEAVSPCCGVHCTWPAQTLCRGEDCGAKLKWSVNGRKNWSADVVPFNIAAKRPFGKLVREDDDLWSSDTESDVVPAYELLE